jgi:hypothetical protein
MPNLILSDVAAVEISEAVGAYDLHEFVSVGRGHLLLFTVLYMVYVK